MEQSLGSLVKKLRLNAGFESQRSLAVAIGASNATIARIESNEQVPLPTTLKRLSKCLSASYEELMTAAGYLEGDMKEEVSEYAPTSQDLKG